MATDQGTDKENLNFSMLHKETLIVWKFHFLTENHLRDIPRQWEEYEVISASCHITSILRAGVEYLFYFMTNSRYIFVTK